MVSGRYGKLFTLRHRAEYLRVQNQGRRVKTRTLVVLALPSSASRVGITVSKKVGNSVIRNRVRRRIRELLRTGRVCVLDCHDVVVIAYPTAARASSTELANDLRKALGRLRGKNNRGRGQGASHRSD